MKEVQFSIQQQIVEGSGIPPYRHKSCNIIGSPTHKLINCILGTDILN